MRANDGLTPGGEAMSLPKATAILPRTNNPLKAKVAKASKPTKVATRPAHDLPELAFPTSYDLKHAMLAFPACYGCGAALPEAGLLPKCDGCGARMCGECENRCRSCACKQIKRYYDKRATLMTAVTDNAPSYERWTIGGECCVWFETETGE
jgi:hypothetical protein